MQTAYAIITCMLVGYLIGGMNPSFLLAKGKGFDIRTKGSGNAGASNAMLMLGKTAGIFCAIFDILKAYIIVKIMTHIYPFLKIAGILAGAACILGHMYPVFMGFRGGKGLACLAGLILAYNARLFIRLFLVELLIAFVTSYICTVATTGSTLFCALLLIREGPIYAILFCPVVVAVWKKHKINFLRIQYGVEAKLKYLWNKEAEEKRVRNNWNQLSIQERNLVALPEPN